jgi:hypothetical protein
MAGAVPESFPDFPLIANAAYEVLSKWKEIPLSTYEVLALVSTPK